jgi:hypothetical protein
MKKYIVTTTINSPTEATRKFAEIAKRDGWIFVVVGDSKTPHEEYKKLNCIYLHPATQTELYPELSEVIGWKTIQRRNIGFIYAYKNGAEIVATVDDDNIPYDNWGQNVYVGKEVEVDYYRNTKFNIFDPLSVTNHSYLWHRGYPIEMLHLKNEVEYQGKKIVIPLIQADLWDGDPDIDAMARLSFKPIVKFDTKEPFASSQLSPFNSQNTFIHRQALQYYAVWPYVGRMDDIWGGYFAQSMLGPDRLIYNKASVYQDRNTQDLIKNLENEIIGYRNTFDFSQFPNSNKSYIPEQTLNFLKLYFKQF